MTTLRTLKKLVLGETWILPLGIASMLVAAALIRHADPSAWRHLGPIVLVAAVVLVLYASVARSARRRR